MATFEETVKKVIEGNLQAGEAHLETLPNGHVCGHIISREFTDKTYEERRLRLKEILEKGLNQNEILNISTLLTYTPEEWSVELKES